VAVTTAALSIAEVARRVGISRQAVQDRLRRGWTLDEVLAGQRAQEPPRPPSIAEQCAEAGVSTAAYYRRRREGLSHDEALALRRSVGRPRSR
jgi:transposase